MSLTLYAIYDYFHTKKNNNVLTFSVFTQSHIENGKIFTSMILYASFPYLKFNLTILWKTLASAEHFKSTSDLVFETKIPSKIYSILIEGNMQWFSGRVLDWRQRSSRFKPHRRHSVVSLSKTHLSLLSTGSTQEDPSLHKWKIVNGT